MPDNPRLTHLLELADKGPALRNALMEELTELLAFWPSDCPEDMRAPCEALLARAAREADNAGRGDCAPARPNNNLARTLVEMARAGMDIRARLAEALKLSRSRLEEILATDHGLALVCKRLDLSRTSFSTLAMLMAGKGDATQCYAALDLYETVTEDAAEDLRAANNVVSFRREPHAARAS